MRHSISPSLNQFTKDQVIRFFKEEHRALLTTLRKNRDWPAIQLAWITYTDSLQKQGRITELQRTTWCLPAFLKKGGSVRKKKAHAVS